MQPAPPALGSKAENGRNLLVIESGRVWDDDYVSFGTGIPCFASFSRSLGSADASFTFFRSVQAGRICPKRRDLAVFGSGT
jgi:hypothetical protein